MQWHVLLNSDGGIVMAVATNAPAPEGFITLDADDVDPDRHYYRNGALAAYTPEQRQARLTPPHPGCTWSNSSMSWVDPRTLEQHKADRWEHIKRQREAAFDAPLATAYGTFDSDAVARQNITDAAQLATTLIGMGQSGTIDFTRADNTTATLTYAQMVEVALTLGAKIQAAYATGRARRAQIDAATTIGEVEAVTW
jgi:hypothetical protein